MKFFKHPLTISAVLIAVTAYAAPKVYINLDSTQPQVFKRKTGATTSETVATIDTTGGNPMEFNQGVKVSAGKPLIADSIETNTGATPPGMVPLGGTVMVFPHLDATEAWQPPASGSIKDGFMLADGSTVPTGQGSPLQGKTLPDLVGKYAKGGTTITSGDTGGSNTVTPTGTVSQPSFSGSSTLHTAWFKNASVTAGGSFSGNALANTAWFKNSGMSLTFTGATTSYTVNVPGHTHNHSLASSLGLSGSAPSLSNNLVAANGHTHDAPAHYHGFSLTAAGQSYTGSVTSVAENAHTHSYDRVVYVGTGGFFNGGGAEYTLQSFSTGAGSSHAHNVNLNHTHNASSVSGSVGNTGGSNGNSAMGTTVNSSSITVGISGGSYSLTGSNNVTGTVGSGVDDGDSFFTASGNNTPSGSVTMVAANDNMQEWAAAGSYTPSGSVTVTMNAANDNMQEWAATGSYTPSGTVSQPTFTGDSQGNEPAYVTGVWVIRVL